MISTKSIVIFKIKYTLISPYWTRLRFMPIWKKGKKKNEILNKVPN